ncbi:hypothetical protein Tco_1292321 [Tanacetum coccineum]
MWEVWNRCHFKRDCRSGKKKNANAGGSGKGSKDQSQDQGFGYYNRMLLTHHKQNGVAERKNRALMVERVNSCYLLRVVVRLPGPRKGKLLVIGKRLLIASLLDCEHSKAYRFYVIEPNNSVSINSIIESRDAIFDENRFSSIPRPKDIIPNLEESQRDDHSDDVPSETPEPRRGKRAKKAKSYGSDFQLYLVGDQERSIWEHWCCGKEAECAPTMARAYSQIYNGKSRHLGVRHSMVRELIKNGVISIEFVRTQADHLTKGLARDLRLEHVCLSSRGARSKGTTYVNMKFSRFKKLGLGFLYVH